MKYLLIMGLVMLTTTGCGLLEFAGVQPSRPVNPPVAPTLLTGKVVENRQEAPADGNNYLVVETETGIITVLYFEGGLVPPEMAAEQCNANLAVAQSAQSIETGDDVQVYGLPHDVYDFEVCSRTGLDIIAAGGNSSQETRTVSGTIVELISDCAFDGNCAYVVETETGERVTVVWAEGMSPICENDPFQGGYSDFVTGDRIDAFGRVLAADTISACGDPDYYIRNQG